MWSILPRATVSKSLWRFNTNHEAVLLDWTQTPARAPDAHCCISVHFLILQMPCRCLACHVFSGGAGGGRGGGKVVAEMR